MTEDDIARAVAHLSAADPVMAGVVARVGPCTLRPGGDPFLSLARAVVGQQISVHAAASIWARFQALYPAGITPGEVAETPAETLRAAGLSRTKAAYIQDLGRRFAEGAISEPRLHALGDEEVIDLLVQVKGIGRWTAEMSLIFCLDRPDVLPVDDLGFQIAVQNAYGLPGRPKAADLRQIAVPWRPWRSVATWYLWASRRLPANPRETEAQTTA